MSAVRKIVDSNQFDIGICAVIVANAATLGLGTFPAFVNNPILDGLNSLFYAVFVVELALRISAYGPRRFFKRGWNVFDFVAITAAMIPGLSASAQALRLVRLARVVRLVRFLPDARLLIAGAVKSLPALGSLLALTGLMIFLYGMMAVGLFGATMPEQFGNIGAASLTLFVMLSLENFPDTLYGAMEASPWAVPFFISYALLAAFVVFNLIIGIVISSLEQARDDQVADDATVAIGDVRDCLDRLERQLADKKTSAKT
jgi:voltage-gated sodium channel